MDAAMNSSVTRRRELRPGDPILAIVGTLRKMSTKLDSSSSRPSGPCEKIRGCWSAACGRRANSDATSSYVGADNSTLAGDSSCTRRPWPTRSRCVSIVSGTDGPNSSDRTFPKCVATKAGCTKQHSPPPSFALVYASMSMTAADPLLEQIRQMYATIQQLHDDTRRLYDYIAAEAQRARDDAKKRQPRKTVTRKC
jgi:hypothetical protein